MLDTQPFFKEIHTPVLCLALLLSAGLVPSLLVSGQSDECNAVTVGEDYSRCSVCKPDDPTFCLKCDDDCFEYCTGYYVTDKGECSRCPSGVAACAKVTGEVMECQPGYGLVAGECRPCKDEQCEVCNGDLWFCSQCRIPEFENRMDGFYPDTTGLCTPCDAGCYKCDGPEQCTLCHSSALDTETGLCMPCTDANCLSCMTAANQCDECKDGYRLDAATSTCTACSDVNCRRCFESADLCTDCNTGYGLVGGKCTRCADPDCAWCDDNPAVCRSCANYTMSIDAATQLCSSCQSPNCIACGSNTTTCSNGGCMEGFFFNETTLLCEPCTVPGCLHCGSDPLQCAPSYYGGCMPNLWWNNATLACEPCADSGCEICQIFQGTACERCMDGFYLEQDTRQCKQCTDDVAALYGACTGSTAVAPSAS